MPHGVCLLSHGSIVQSPEFDRHAPPFSNTGVFTESAGTGFPMLSSAAFNPQVHHSWRGRLGPVGFYGAPPQGPPTMLVEQPQLSASEEMQMKLQQREQQKGLARQGIQTTTGKFQQEQNIEGQNVAQERALDTIVGDSHVLTEDQEVATQNVQGALSGQVKAIVGEEEALAEKVRLLKHLEELNKPVQGRRPRIKMVSVEAEKEELKEPESPASGGVGAGGPKQYTIKVVPGPRVPEVQDKVYLASAVQGEQDGSDKPAVIEIQRPKPTPLVRLTEAHPAEQSMRFLWVLASCVAPLVPTVQGTGRRSRAVSGFF